MVRNNLKWIEVSLIFVLQRSIYYCSSSCACLFHLLQKNKLGRDLINPRIERSLNKSVTMKKTTCTKWRDEQGSYSLTLTGLLGTSFGRFVLDLFWLLGDLAGLKQEAMMKNSKTGSNAYFDTTRLGHFLLLSFNLFRLFGRTREESRS